MILLLEGKISAVEDTKPAGLRRNLAIEESS
jgi:hypothetical protein